MARQQGLFDDDQFETPVGPAPWERDAARGNVH